MMLGTTRGAAEQTKWSYGITLILLAAAFLVAPLSQIPAMLEWPYSRLILYVAFMLSFVVLFICAKESLNRIKVFWVVALALLFASYCLLLNLYFTTGYINGYFFRAVMMSVFFYMIGLLAGGMISEPALKCLITIYFVGAIVATLFILSGVYTGFSDWLNSFSYLYDGKNSIGVIIITSMTGVLFYAIPRNKFLRVLEFAGCAYLLFFLMVMQARLAFLGMASSVVFFIIFVSKHRIRWIAVLLVILALLFLISDTREILIKSLRLEDINMDQGQDYLDAFSSGRLSGVGRALERIEVRPLFGYGKYYIDMMYVSIVAELGIIGAVLPVALFVMLAVQNFMLWRRSSASMKPLTVLAVMLTLQCVVETLGEALPPFGPGTTVLLFWFVSAYAWQVSSSMDRESTANEMYRRN